ncbi:MAG: hypothetical protein K0S39_5024 [Paenibacillus sp.]|jgi:hypothetical protein|nr:hypothetical protein [Paenibacillus sp.]
MALSLWAELFLWMIVLAGIVGGFCACLHSLVTNDTTEYDMEFLWDHRFTLQDLELDQKIKH